MVVKLTFWYKFQTGGMWISSLLQPILLLYFTIIFHINPIQFQIWNKITTLPYLVQISMSHQDTLPISPFDKS